MSTARRRKQWRDYARRKRARILAEVARSRTTCPRRAGRTECGGILETIVLRDGRTALRCPRCERLRAGICLECPAKVYGRVGWARRCRFHFMRACLYQSAKWRANNHKRVIEYHRRRRQLKREELKASCRRWREQNPEKVRAYNEIYKLRRRARTRARIHDELRRSA